MENLESCEFAVIGLGAVGSAALYHLSKSGKKVLGLDRFDPPHTMGSSHGETRITRLAVGEGEEYVALARRSHQLWRELEHQSGHQIMSTTGGILIDSGVNPWAKHGAEGFWDRTVRYAKNQDIAHRIPNLDQVREEFPAFQIPSTGKVYIEEEAGYLRPELAISTQLNLAEAQGAHVLRNSPAEWIGQNPDGFEIKTPKGIIRAKKILLSSGGWIKDFLEPDEKPKFKICRQVLHWLEIEQGFDWSNYPIWMWGFGPKPEDFIYGFPSIDGKTVKMATESFVEIDHPDLLNRAVEPFEQSDFWINKILGKITGLKPVFTQSKVCFYTVTEDAKFVIEPWRGNPNALVVSACSGHGFKHSAALGEKLALSLLRG